MEILDEKMPKEPQTEYRNMPLANVLATYDLVEAYDGDTPYLLVTDRHVDSSAFALRETPPSLYEIGSTNNSSISLTSSEYNTELRGSAGYEKYERMRRSDGVIRGTLLGIKTPAMAGRWFVKAASSSKKDKKVADWVWYNLTELMTTSFGQFKLESLLFCDYGNYGFEKVWEERIIGGNPRIVLRKLAPRHPKSVNSWKYDSHGGPQGIVYHSEHQVVENANTWEYILGQDVFIPITKLLWFTLNKEANDMEGISALRAAYKHWYFNEQLYKIDAIQKERHGIGVPVIKLPVLFTPADRQLAEQLGRNLRTNEMAHVVVPANWDIIFAKLEGQPVNAINSILMHNSAIRDSVLIGFIASDRESETQQDMFMKSTKLIADIVCDTINLHLIPQMVKYNFDNVEEMPKLLVRRVGEQVDGRTMSFAIRNLVGAGALRPDDVLEEHLRDQMDLPNFDEDTSRAVVAPQMPKVPVPDPKQDKPVDDPSIEDPEDKKKNKRRIGRQDMNQDRPGLPRQSLPTPHRVGNKAGSFDRSGSR